MPRTGPLTRRRMACVLVVAWALALVGLGSAAAGAQVTDPLSDPAAAVRQAMRDVGIDPAAGDTWVRLTLARAADLVHITVRDQPESLYDTALFRQSLRDLVGASASGVGVYGGWSPAQLRALAARARTADGATDPGGAALAARLRWDDALSLGIYMSSISGLNTLTRRSTEAMAVSDCEDWRYGRVSSAGTFANCLEYVLRER